MNRKKLCLIFVYILAISSIFPQVSFAEETTTVSEVEPTEATVEEEGEATESAPQEMVIVETGEYFPITATKKIADNGNYELYFDEESANIRVVNKKSGKEWLGAPQMDKATLPNNKAFIDSPVHIEYTDGQSISQTYTMKDATFTTTEIENGIRVDFAVEEIKATFSVEYTLTAEGFEAKIPADSVDEKGAVRLNSLELMPFFHAADRKENGAVFVPDGAGALMKIREKHPQYFSGYSQPVYGPDATFMADLGDVIASGFTRGNPPREKIALPVYGIFHDEQAYLAVISEGEETAHITATPSGIRNIPLYRAGTKFYYRKQDELFIGNSGKIPLFQGHRMDGDRKITFILLEDEDANYVGMANAYREYLIENDGMERVTEKDAPLHIELVGGIQREEIIGKTFVDLTTFEQARSVIDDYVEKGVTNLQLTIKGWSKNGLYGNQPKHFPVERKLGGKKDLQELIDHAKKAGVDLFLDVNYVRPFSESKGIKARKDVVRGIDREILENPNYRVSSRLRHSGQIFHLLKPKKSATYARKDLQEYERLGVAGIHFAHIGKMLYSDQDTKSLTSRKDMMNEWSETVDQYREKVEQISVDYGFSYLLGQVDKINEIPMDSSHFVYLDETVPFYQIVVHGLIPYTAKPTNLRDDSINEFLRAVEYGALPSYELTYKSTDHLQRTMEERLFSSDYGYWADRSIEEYSELVDLYENIADQFIVDHQQVAKNIFKTSYENGIEVLVNYNQSAKTIDGHTVEGSNYMVIKGKGE